MSLALAHEYFSAHGGAERVVEVFHRMYPDAPVYTFFHDRRSYGPLPGYRLRTSFLQVVPLAGGLHRALWIPPKGAYPDRLRRRVPVGWGVLWSAGPDGVDNGGVNQYLGQSAGPYSGPGARTGTDMIFLVPRVGK